MCRAAPEQKTIFQGLNNDLKAQAEKVFQQSRS